MHRHYFAMKANVPKFIYLLIVYAYGTEKAVVTDFYSIRAM